MKSKLIFGVACALVIFSIFSPVYAATRVVKQPDRTEQHNAIGPQPPIEYIEQKRRQELDRLNLTSDVSIGEAPPDEEDTLTDLAETAFVSDSLESISSEITDVDTKIKTDTSRDIIEDSGTIVYACKDFRSILYISDTDYVTKIESADGYHFDLYKYLKFETQEDLIKELYRNLRLSYSTYLYDDVKDIIDKGFNENTIEFTVDLYGATFYFNEGVIADKVIKQRINIQELDELDVASESATDAEYSASVLSDSSEETKVESVESTEAESANSEVGNADLEAEIISHESNYKFFMDMNVGYDIPNYGTILIYPELRTADRITADGASVDRIVNKDVVTFVLNASEDEDDLDMAAVHTPIYAELVFVYNGRIEKVAVSDFESVSTYFIFENGKFKLKSETDTGTLIVMDFPSLTLLSKDEIEPLEEEKSEVDDSESEEETEGKISEIPDKNETDEKET